MKSRSHDYPAVSHVTLYYGPRVPGPERLRSGTSCKSKFDPDGFFVPASREVEVLQCRPLRLEYPFGKSSLPGVRVGQARYTTGGSHPLDHDSHQQTSPLPWRSLRPGERI